MSDSQSDATMIARSTMVPGPPEVETRRRGFFSKWLVVVLLVLFVGGFAIGRWVVGDDESTAATGSRSPSATTPTLSVDPSTSALSGLVVRQGDVDASLSVQLLKGGSQVTGQTTLDLCNGTYPSESRRTARLQVVVLDKSSNNVLSTEAVLYSNAAAATQAFGELKSVAAHCPNKPVVSPVGEPTVTTHFNAAPDGNWASTPTVDRLAYSITTTDQSAQVNHSVAVYLRRGRALMGVYFSQPDATQTPVAGQATLAGIATLFANRMAQLPASVVNPS